MSLGTNYVQFQAHPICVRPCMHHVEPGSDPQSHKNGQNGAEWEAE